MNELDFKVGEWYKSVNPEHWYLWNYKEETDEWSHNGTIIAEKFLLLKIIDIGGCDYGKFFSFKRASHFL